MQTDQPNQAVITWVSDSRTQGKTDAEIRDALVRQGWSSEMVSSIFTMVNTNMQPSGGMTFTYTPDASDLGKVRQKITHYVPIAAVLMFVAIFGYSLLIWHIAIWFDMIALVVLLFFLTKLIQAQRQSKRITAVQYTLLPNGFTIATGSDVKNFNWDDFSFFADGYFIQNFVRHQHDPALFFLRKRKVSFFDRLFVFLGFPYIQLIVPIPYETAVRQLLEQRYGPEQRPLVNRFMQLRQGQYWKYGRQSKR